MKLTALFSGTCLALMLVFLVLALAKGDQVHSKAFAAVGIVFGALAHRSLENQNS